MLRWRPAASGSMPGGAPSGN